MEFSGTLASESVSVCSSTGVVAVCGEEITLAQTNALLAYAMRNSYAQPDVHGPLSAAEERPETACRAVRIPLSSVSLPAWTDASEAEAADPDVLRARLREHAHSLNTKSRGWRERVACARWSPGGVWFAHTRARTRTHAIGGARTADVAYEAVATALGFVTSSGRLGIIGVTPNLSRRRIRASCGLEVRPHTHTHTHAHTQLLAPAVAAHAMHDLQPLCCAWMPKVHTQTGAAHAPPAATSSVCRIKAVQSCMLLGGRAGVAAMLVSSCVCVCACARAGDAEADGVLVRHVQTAAYVPCTPLYDMEAPAAARLQGSACACVCIEVLPGVRTHTYAHTHTRSHGAPSGGLDDGGDADAVFSEICALGRPAGDVVIARVSVSPSGDVLDAAGITNTNVRVRALLAVQLPGAGVPVSMRWMPPSRARSPSASAVASSGVLAVATSAAVTVWMSDVTLDTSTPTDAYSASGRCVTPARIVLPVGAAASGCGTAFSLPQPHGAEAMRCAQPLRIAAGTPTTPFVVEPIIATAGGDGAVQAWSVTQCLACVGSAHQPDVIAVPILAPAHTAVLRDTTTAIQPDGVIALTPVTTHGFSSGVCSGVWAWMAREHAPPWVRANLTANVSTCPTWISLHPVASTPALLPQPSSQVLHLASGGSLLRALFPFVSDVATGIVGNAVRCSSSACDLLEAGAPVCQVSDWLQTVMVPIDDQPLLAFMESVGRRALGALHDEIRTAASFAAERVTAVASKGEPLPVSLDFLRGSTAMDETFDTDAVFDWSSAPGERELTLQGLDSGAAMLNICSQTRLAASCALAAPLPAAIHGVGPASADAVDALWQSTQPFLDASSPASALTSLLPLLIRMVFHRIAASHASSSVSSDRVAERQLALSRIAWLRLASRLLRWVLTTSNGRSHDFAMTALLHQVQFNGCSIDCCSADVAVPPKWVWAAAALAPHVSALLAAEVSAVILTCVGRSLRDTPTSAAVTPVDVAFASTGDAALDKPGLVAVPVEDSTSLTVVDSPVLRAIRRSADDAGMSAPVARVDFVRLAVMSASLNHMCDAFQAVHAVPVPAAHEELLHLLRWLGVHRASTTPRLEIENGVPTKPWRIAACANPIMPSASAVHVWRSVAKRMHSAAAAQGIAAKDICPVCGAELEDTPLLVRSGASPLFHPATWALHHTTLHPPRHASIEQARALAWNPRATHGTCASGHVFRLHRVTLEPVAYDAGEEENW